MFRRVKEPEGLGGAQTAASARVRGPDSVITRAFRLAGDLSVPGDLHLEGVIEGNVEAAGSIWVGPKAVIVGRVRAVEARIEGRVQGDVHVRQAVDLVKGSRLQGDVYARSFRIEDGSFFQGNCFMGDSWVEED